MWRQAYGSLTEAREELSLVLNVIKCLHLSVCVGQCNLTTHEGIMRDSGVVVLAPKQISIIKMNYINSFFHHEGTFSEHDKMCNDLESCILKQWISLYSTK